MTRTLAVFLYIIVISCASTQASFADSIQYDVKPDNITKQRLKLNIEFEAKQNDAYWFIFLVSDGESPVSPHRSGRLEVKQSGAFVFACDVQERRVDNGLQYMFGINKAFLGDATFTFNNFDPSGMPSADMYKLNLNDFISK